MNKDRKKSIYSNSSIPDRAYRRASVPDYWNVEKSPAIPRALVYDERD